MLADSGGLSGSTVQVAEGHANGTTWNGGLVHGRCFGWYEGGAGDGNRTRMASLEDLATIMTADLRRPGPARMRRRCDGTDRC